MRQLVFVYGTLMRGERNHVYLGQSTLLGRWRTAPAYSLYSLVSYPVACCHGSQSLCGEVYRIDSHTLCQLDALEEYPQVYTRRLLETAWGPAWIYLQHRRPAGARLLAAGDWRRRGARLCRRAGFEPVRSVQGAD